MEGAKTPIYINIQERKILTIWKSIVKIKDIYIIKAIFTKIWYIPEIVYKRNLYDKWFEHNTFSPNLYFMI